LRTAIAKGPGPSNLPIAGENVSVTGTTSDAPRLDCDEWLAATSDEYLYDAINRGPGSFGHGGQPPLGEQIRPAEIADLVTYLRSLAR